MAPPSWAHIGDEFNDLPRSRRLVLTNTEYAFTAVMGSPVAGESEPIQTLPDPPTEKLQIKII